MRYLAIACLLIYCSIAAAEDQVISSLKYNSQASIPRSLANLYQNSGVSQTHEIIFTIVNPFYLQGDFDGDSNQDYAVIVGKRNRKHYYQTETVVMWGNGGVSWIEKDVGGNRPGPAWRLISKGEEVRERRDINNNKPVPKLKGDALILVRPESSSALTYWNGKRFEMYWQSD